MAAPSRGANIISSVTIHRGAAELESLADRADHAATRYPAPAVRLIELAHLVQLSGVRVPTRELSRALALDPGRFRLLNPWRGPWSTLRGRRRRLDPDPEPQLYPIPDGVWVVPRPTGAGWEPTPVRSVLDRMRTCLIRLGWRVDEDSTRDLARWYSLVQEDQRLRARLAEH